MKLYSLLCNEKLYVCVWRQSCLDTYLCHLSHLCLYTWYSASSENFEAWMPERLFSSMKKLSSCESSVGENWLLRSKKRKSRTLEPRVSCSIVTFTVCAKRLKVSVCKVAPGQPGVTTAGLPPPSPPPSGAFLGQAWWVVSLLPTG